MNTTAEQTARMACAELFNPDLVTVRVKTSWVNGFCLPDENGQEEHTAVFLTMSVGDNYVIDKATSYEVEVGRMPTGTPVMVRATDVNEYKRLLVKRNLLSWSLDIPIERDESGWMTPDCYARVSSIPAPLLEAFVRSFETSSEVTEEEEQQISKQCALLFSKNGRGVTDACEAVSKFCTFGNFSEKFGINRDMLPKMPYKEYLLMKIMIAKEGESLRIQHSAANKPNGGGRGRGKSEMRIPLPGSGGA